MSQMGMWGRLSVSKKLYLLVGIMMLLIAAELFTLLFAMNTLSAVRAFVSGEGLWSKAQKAAVLNLQNYARTFNGSYYEEFHRNLEVPFGDHIARLELEKPEPNYDVIFEGFEKGQIHRDDIPQIIKLFERFKNYAYLKEAISIWRKGDDLILSLMEEGQNLHGIISSYNQDPNEINAAISRINDIDAQLTSLENNFSYTLGAGSRWLENILMIVLVLAVLTIESTGLLCTYFFSRNLSMGLKDLNTLALNVTSGNYDHTIKVRSQDEIGQLAENFNKMTATIKQNVGEREQAENANRIKSLFLANMSHEIRTPLGAILGFTELLRDPHITNEERQQYIDIIQKTGSSLTKIINDILDISKVEAGRITIEKTTFSLKALIQEVKSIAELRCNEKGISLSFEKIGDIPANVYTDPDRLRQVIMNVLNNAVKFTDNGEIKVKIYQELSKLVFVVTDTGVGIPKDQQHDLFKAFHQADGSSTKKYQGTGLGLALSKRLAQMLGGDVILTASQPGRGSTFVVTIAIQTSEILRTRQKENSGSLAFPARENTSLAGWRILVVEDSLDNQLLIQKLLTRYGAIVEGAPNGQIGVEKALHNRFDLILMDMQMPVMDGYSATRELRRHGYNRAIIALTAHAMKEDRVKCIEAGCDEYLTKPINLPDVISTITRFSKKPCSSTSTPQPEVTV